MSAKHKIVKEPRIFENIFDSLVWLTEHKDAGLINQIFLNDNLNCVKNSTLNHSNFTQEDKHINVLITGSLYLVGLALEVLNFKI
jgi:hypothetical protein